MKYVFIALVAATHLLLADAFVTNSLDCSISVINTKKDTVIATLPAAGVGYSPFWVAITPNGQEAYVTNLGVSSVTVINTATDTASNILVGRAPRFLAITPDGSE